ncbi:hypothetical protein H7171_02265 [Candidatus Saccharibacteria bacterium]|nr:hypothetical protein [Candidatus Saccharibacteria bacterium]
MKNHLPTKPFISRRIVSGLSSRKFFIAIVVLLGIQALWIALTGKYPMAFDEDFHLGLIRLYADHASPFWSTYPPGGNAYGALTRDPSYLYHFLMSFPYRLIRLFTSDQTIQVLILRFINTALFLSGLPLYQRLLRKTGASKALVNAVLLLFVLIPIVPLLVGQINYDNLLFPLVALTLLLAIRVITSIKAGSLSMTASLQFLTVGLIASLVKYAFLPIFVAAFIVVLVLFIRTFGVRSIRLHKIHKKTVVAAFAGRATKLSLAAFIIIFALAFERYGINVIRYHSPVPDCNQVLTIAQCRSYGPWVRDYDLIAIKSVKSNPMSFTGQWLQGMWLRTFFTLAGPSNDYETRGPFLVPAISSVVFVGLGIGAVAIKRRKIWKARPTIFALLGTASLLYLLILFLQQYKLYANTGVPVAINGRYLIPIAPFLILIGALGVRQFIRATVLKIGAVGLTVGCMLLGGGGLTYVLRSNDAWYWPSSPVRTANHAVQKTIGPAIPGYTHPTAFLPYP